MLDRYRLHRRLGSGGFATVWLARDERLDREVAVKILPRERVIGGRFEREARAAARLSHPAIVTLYEAAVDDEGAYLVSELVHGATLDRLLEAGRLSDHDVVQIGIALCHALGHAHAHGVIHRDVKPSNVLVPDHRGTGGQLAKLTDFGVARVLGGDSLTRTGDVIGTVAYMAPEQAQGLPAGEPADLFSLALVLYEGLTGVNPLVSGVVAGRPRRLGAHLPPLRRQRRELPRELGQAIDLALRPRASERGSLVDLHRALVLSGSRVSDEPGVVASPWPTRTLSMPRAEAAESEFAAQRIVREPRTQADARADAASTVPWPRRALAGVAAAALGAWLASKVPGASPVPAAIAGCLASVLVAAAPRAGWAALALTAAASLIVHSHPGTALLVLAAALVPVVLSPRDGSAWPLAAAAPGLGALGLAGAWPAPAGCAATAHRRASLGVTGWLWLALATRLQTSSLPDAIHHVLGPLLTAGTLTGCAVWGVAAVALPWLRSRRSLALDCALLAAWATALALATIGVSQLADGSVSVSPGATFLGAFVGAVVALVTRRSETRIASLKESTLRRHSRSMETH